MECKTCGIFLPVNHQSRLKNYCGACANERARVAARKWYYKNKDKARQSHLAYRDKHREELIEYSRTYYQTNKKEQRLKQNAYYKANSKRLNKARAKSHREYEKIRRRTDINHRLRNYLRNRIGSAIRNYYKSGSAVRDLGCTIEHLKQYLESKFQPGMTWENHGKHGWHIDHIKPLSSFDLTDREQFLQACHYTNLQPLWAKDNLKKRDRF